MKIEKIIMENKIVAYNLKEISKWQSEITENKTSIELPNLQRGFVWKTHQIEDLWDSIFRGYPIGSILMSLDEEKEIRFLLDGQQRCTSIALGHFDPFIENKKQEFFSLKDYLPSVWIDLYPSKSSGNNKFLIRVLTKSHPWGYQIARDKNGNAQPLSMADRRDALKGFNNPNNKSYINLNSSEINPWDAYYPVPLVWLLNCNADKEEDLIAMLKEKTKYLKIKTKYSGNNFVDFENFNWNLNKIYKGIANAKALLIPEIIVKSSLLKDDDEVVLNESQNPTLFVRLNSSGTNISGEELIYSIYKAVFPQAKEIVEKIEADFIAPSKLINLISRLAYCEMNNYQNFPRSFNINSFRKELRNSDFINLLNKYINDGDGNETKNLIEKAKEILSQKTEIPPTLIKKFIVSSPDLFMVLLVYIKKNNLQNSDLEQSVIKEISASYVQLLWFSYDNSKISSQLFDLFKDDSLSWSKAIEELIIKNQVVPLLKPKLLRENLIEIVVNQKHSYGDFEKIKALLSNDLKTQLLMLRKETLDSSNEEENEEKENNKKIEFEMLLKHRWWYHIDKIFRNRDFLIYAQRDYFNEKFKEFNQYDYVEDTNRPWDWDHIYPKSWIDNKKGISPLIRHWANSIGNLRALSYDDNRSENNRLSPEQRLKEDQNKNDSFILDNDLAYWIQLSSRIKTDDELSNFLSASIHRMINIYEDWYRNYYSKN